MIDKVFANVDAAVADLPDDITVMVGGFGGAGFPLALRDALARRRPRRLTIICNNADFGDLVYEDGLVHVICSYPVGATAGPLVQAVEDGRVTLSLTPQGTLAEQIRAGGAGLGGFLTPTGVGTDFESTGERVYLNGRDWLLVPSLRADVALVRAHVADRYGNLIHRHAGRNFSPAMASAAALTIAEVTELVEPGALDPNAIHIPAAFVDRVVVV